MPGKLVHVSAFGVMALALVSCGGSTRQSTTTSPKANGATKTSAKASPAPAPVLAETVEVPKPGAKLSHTASAKNGEAVLFHTTVGGSASRRQEIRLSLSQGPGSGWTVTASANGHRSAATLTSTNGTTLKLDELRYACELPPTPTFCPVRHVRRSSNGYQLEFAALPSTGVTIAATVGGSAQPAGLGGRSGTSAEPPYAATAEALAEPSQPSTASGGTKARFGSSITAKAGDLLLLAIHLTGSLNGAPQTLTISFDEGPGKTLKASARTPGGKPATTTIRSATGAPITIVTPHYDCYLPPTPTFCPAKGADLGSGRYSLTFKASPGTPLIVLHAEVHGR